MKAAVVLLIVTVLFYWKVLLTHQFSFLTGYEGVNQTYAWLNFWVRSIHQGSWPLWDPYTLSGHIFAGEMQTQGFYPLYLPLVMFSFNQHGVFAPALYHVMIAVVHFLGAWLMFLLVRELKLGDFPAIMAGVCFSLGGFLGRLPGWPHLLNSGIWLPLIFLFLLRAIKAESVARLVCYASACGLSLGLSILAGGLHVAIMQAIVIVSAAVFSGFSAGSMALDQGPLKPWQRTALMIGVGGLAAFTSGAVQLLPSIEYSHLAWRWVGAAAFPASEQIPYHYLNDGIFAHGIFNFLIAVAYGQIGFGEAINPYMGVFPLLLAVIGIWKNWRRPWVRYLTGLAVSAYVYSLGSVSLLHGVLYALTPFLSLAREASRFMYLADFALAILAAYGAEILFSSANSEWEPLSRILKWLAVVAVLAIAVPALYGQLGLSPWISLSLVLIVASWLLFRYITSGHTGAWPRFLVVALILFDLNAFDWSATDRIDVFAKGQDKMEQLLSCSGVAQFLKSRPGLFRAQVAMDWAPNIGDVFQVQETGGSGVTGLATYSVINSHPDLLNVRYVVKPATAPGTGAVYQDSAWKVYENPRAFPRGWLVHDTIVEPSPAVLVQRLNASAIDLHRSALLPTRLDAPLDAVSETAVEQLHFDRYEANRLDVSVHAAGRALLVLSELAYPGWRATVNNRPVHIRKVDGGLRGIVVPTGDSWVSLQYRPSSIYIGGALTIASFGGVFAAFIWFWFRRKSNRLPPAPRTE